MEGDVWVGFYAAGVVDHVPHTLHFHQVPLTVLGIHLIYAAGVVDHIPHTLHFHQVPLTNLDIYLLYSTGVVDQK